SKFDIIKDAITTESYCNDIAYKDNDNKRIPIVELIKLMFAFNIKKYPDDSGAPVAAYSGKAIVFKDYKNEYEQADNIYKGLVNQLPKLVELYEKIQADLPIKYQDFKKEDGKNGRFGLVRGVEGAGSYLTLFNQKSISHEISVGFLLPIFGAFRALLQKKDDKINWAFDPIEIWEKVGIRLVQNTFDTDTNPQQTGKSKTLWQSNYRIVDSIRKDLLLEQLMKQQQQ
ncbi:TPA: abortive phage infection protein, partial [Bacillus cereus]